jgi:pyruvate, water dikinase
VGQGRVTGKLYIVQARPETVKSRGTRATQIERFHLSARGEVLAEGRAIGQKIGSGVPAWCARWTTWRGQPGDVLVADMTDPDWEPIMKRASAIVTNRGGRTCHAAIIARELGVPAVVGTGDATEDRSATAAGHGQLRRGRHRFHLRGKLPSSASNRPRRDAAGAAEDHDERRQPGARLRLRDAAQRRHRPGAPGDDHRRHIGVHPKALLEYDQQPPRSRRRSTSASPATPTRSPSTSTAWPRASPRSPPLSRRTR